MIPPIYGVLKLPPDPKWLRTTAGSFIKLMWYHLYLMSMLLLIKHPEERENNKREYLKLISNNFRLGNTICWAKIIGQKQSLLTKSHNSHALEMEAQPPHMTFRPNHIDFYKIATLWHRPIIST